MTNIIGAELTALSAPGFGFFRPWYRPYPYGVFVGAEADDFEQLYAEFSRFWQDVQANVNAATARITSDPEYQAIQNAWMAEEARHKTLTSRDARIASVNRQRELHGKRYDLYQRRKIAFPVLVWESTIYEPVRMQLLSLGEQIKSRLSGESAGPIDLGRLYPPTDTAGAIQHYREFLTALQNSAPFAPYPNKGWIQPGVKSPALGAEVPQRTGLTAELAPIVAPATGGVTVEKRLDDKQVLHVRICVDGKCYQTSMNLAPAIAMVMQKLARWHDGVHAPKPPPSTVISTVETAVGMAEDAIVGALIARHVDTIAAGILGDIAGAVKGAVTGVASGVASTFKKLKGPIGVAAGIAAASAAAAIPGVGPIVAPMAGKFANDLVQAAAGDNKAKQAVAQAQQKAKTDPTTALALETAAKAVANSTAAHHVQDTAKKAAAGDPTAKQQIAQVATDAEQGDPAAKAVADLVANAMKSEWGAKLWERATGRGPGVVSGWASYVGADDYHTQNFRTLNQEVEAAFHELKRVILHATPEHPWGLSSDKTIRPDWFAWWQKRGEPFFSAYREFLYSKDRLRAQLHALQKEAESLGIRPGSTNTAVKGWVDIATVGQWQEIVGAASGADDYHTQDFRTLNQEVEAAFHELKRVILHATPEHPDGLASDKTIRPDWFAWWQKRAEPFSSAYREFLYSKDRLRDQLHALKGEAASLGIRAGSTNAAVKGWVDIATVGQWQEIVGAALEDIRDVARTHASTKRGEAAGVIQYADGTLHGRGFGSLERAMEWLKHATRNRTVFIYAAACDKAPDGSARIHDEAIGEAKPRAVKPNAPVATVG